MAGAPGSSRTTYLSYDLYFLTKNFNLCRPICPWWDSECAVAIKKRRAAIKMFRKKGLMSAFMEARRQIALCKKFLKWKKLQRFRKFCESLNCASNISEVWKSIGRFAGSFNYPKNYNQISYDSSWVNSFLDKIAPMSVKNQLNIPNTNSPDLDWLVAPISDEFLAAIEYKKNSAPGCYSISYKMIANLPRSGHEVLLKIFNEALSTSNTRRMERRNDMLHTQKRWHNG